MAKIKGQQMDSSADSQNIHTNVIDSDLQEPEVTEGMAVSMNQIPGISSLKPKMDSIFSEVVKNLPEIDFDESDISSDEEPVIFHQHLKSSLIGIENDQDASGSSESSPIDTPIPQLQDSSPVDTSSIVFSNYMMQTYDNDLAYLLQKEEHSEKSSWTDVFSKKEDTDESRDDNEEDNVINDIEIKSDSGYENPELKWMEMETHAEDLDKDIDTAEEDLDQNNVNEKEERVDSGLEVEDTFTDTAEKKRAMEESITSRNTMREENLTEENWREDWYHTLSETDKEDKKMKRQFEKEKQRTKDMLIATSYVSANAPVLSTKALNNIDLDSLLQSLQEDNRYGPPRPRTALESERRNNEANKALHEAEEGSLKTSGQKSSGSLTLIQRLAQIAMEESGVDISNIDPTTGAIRSNAEEKKDTQESAKEHKKTVMFEQKDEETPIEKKTASCGTNTNDFVPRILTPRVLKIENKKEERGATVFLDLRNFEQQKQEQKQSIGRVQQILRIDPRSRQSDSSDSEDDVSWQEQRKKLKHNLSAKGTAAAALPSKPQPARPIPSYKQPARVINLSNRLPSKKVANESASEPEVTALSGEAKAIREAELVAEREKVQRLEVAKKLREERDQDRQNKIRLGKRLEAMRPSASVSGRQSCAEATPVIFDIDASYEPAPCSLPPILTTHQECLLLSVHLSSNGEIILHRGKSNKSVDTGDGLSASYTALLTWLLSLVPHNFSYLQEKSNKTDSSLLTLPFNVIGLQQLCMNEQLSLMVAVTPTEQFDAKFFPGKSKKGKLKDELKDSSTFQQHMIKFLSTNTIKTVCPWLEDMESMEVVSAQEVSSEHQVSYVYRPPLPEITTKPLSTFIQVNSDPQAAFKVFNTSVGFFWQTVDCAEGFLDQNLNDENVSYDTQITMSLIYKKIFQEPCFMMGFFNRLLQEGLDLAGVRLLYPTQELLSLPMAKPSVTVDSSDTKSKVDVLNNIGPVLAIGIRGTFARSIWLDAVGPSDPALARRTDPNSLCALYGGASRDECLLFCPRNTSRIQSELARWFGARVPPGGSIDVGQPYVRKDHLRNGSPKGRKSKKVTWADSQEENDPDHNLHRPPATLTATTKSEIFLVLSPLVPPKSFGIILATCQRRGYQVRGVKRCRLSTKRAASLGITGGSLDSFCPGTGATSDSLGTFEEALTDHHDHLKQGKQQEADFPSTILQLQKENASHNAASLIEACMVQLTLQGIMNAVQAKVGHHLESRHLLHAASYSDSLLNALGGDFSKCFDPEIQINPNYVLPQLHTNPELEQITVLLLLGHDILKSCGLFVGKLMCMLPYSRTPTSLPFTEGLELLGMKWIPSLSPTQAKEVTRYEVGDRLWKENLHTLTTEPALVLALRGVNAFAKLSSVVQSCPATGKVESPGHQDMLLSRTAEEAYTYIRLFFTERELFADPDARPLLPYLPQSRNEKTENDSLRMKRSKVLTRASQRDESIFDIMLSGPQPITTCLIIKPRAFSKHFPKIMKKVVQQGFNVVGLRLVTIDENRATSLVSREIEDSTEVTKHVSYMTSGPCMCLCLQRENAVKCLLDLLGPLDPQSARRQSQFYWRGVFGVDSVMNGFHGSENYDAAVTEQKMLFPDGLCCEPTKELQMEQIPCCGEDSIIDMKHFYTRHVNIIKKEASSNDNLLEGTHNLLLQTSCIVLTPLLLRKWETYPGYVEIIDALVTHGFSIVGARMIWFSKAQAELFLHVIDAGSFQLVPLLLSGPSVVLALERENAVVAFNSILGGTTHSDSLLSKYGSQILQPPDVKHSHQMLTFFFDHLIPGSQVEIVMESETVTEPQSDEVQAHE
ncbi:hypothetical protein ACJMK2_025289 [Sinanodonta woodiana]|uniref:Nucleoside diphosphate kinase-like domain-containing protein n=1 Tax=Sinanodonta woodiana TaxID=1069815 RepID=A0ABD3XIE9_SINWO